MLSFKYTPIIIHYRPAVLDENDQPFEAAKYTMRITSPRSNRKGVEQAIPSQVVVQIPTDAPLKLKLMPSDLYLPLGKYKVEYFKYGVSTPVETQTWIVPTTPTPLNFNIVFDGNDIVLPYNTYSVTSLSPYYEWQLNYNKLVFISENLPDLNTQFQILYQPAVTLDRLIQLEV